MTSSPQLHTRHADARGNSTSEQSCTSLNHLKNVLLCVNQCYHLPFRLHSNIWKTTSLTHCLVNTIKYTPRRNPSVGKKPLVFVNSSKCIAIAKSTYKFHVTISHVGKHKRHFSNYSLLTVTVTTVDNEVAARISCRLKDGHAQCTGNATRETGSVHGTARRPHFTLAIISVTVQIWIEVFWVVSVYLNLRNILPKFGTFLPGHRVYVCVCMHAYMYPYMYVCSIRCRYERHNVIYTDWDWHIH